MQPQLLADMIAVLNVLLLRGTKVGKKLPGFRRVIPETHKGQDPRLLLGDMLLALQDVQFGFFQVAKLHRAIHEAA